MINLKYQLQKKVVFTHIICILYNFNSKKRKLIKKLFDYLAKKNIFLQVHYIPIYKQPYYKKFNYKINSFPVSENFYNNSFSLPIYKSLLKKDLEYITKTILKYTI